MHDVRPGAGLEYPYPYNPHKFKNAPEKEKAVLSVFNHQWMKVHYYAPEIRAKYRYLETPEQVDVGDGTVFMSAGAIIPKRIADIRAKMFGARGGATQIGGRPTTKDHLLAVRPVSKRSTTSSSWGGNRQRTTLPRFAALKLGPSRHRKNMYLPYGYVVYLLRHPEFNAAFPLSYELKDAGIAKVEHRGVKREVLLDNIDQLHDEPNGAQIYQAAVDEFNRQYAQGLDPQSVMVDVPAQEPQLVQVDTPQYNSWFPENLEPTLIEPTWTYEKMWDEFEYYLDNGGTHYPNNFEMELAFFHLGDTEHV